MTKSPMEQWLADASKRSGKVRMKKTRWRLYLIFTITVLVGGLIAYGIVIHFSGPM